MKKILHWSFLLLTAAIVFTGCAGKVAHMKPVTESQVSLKPSDTEATMVFLRPSTFGFAIQSSVYEIVGDQPEIVGIVAAKKKVTYTVKPGKHLFMVVGESADFMEANVEAGKTYYATVVPRMGFWKARFSFNPLHRNEYDANPAELDAWMKDCEWVIKTPETERWFQENRTDIAEKYVKYYKVWEPKEEKPILLPEDGI